MSVEIIFFCTVVLVLAGVELISFIVASVGL